MKRSQILISFDKETEEATPKQNKKIIMLGMRLAHTGRYFYSELDSEFLKRFRLGIPYLI
jgi:hypothetical protein